jgi:hypothetical protein
MMRGSREKCAAAGTQGEARAGDVGASGKGAAVLVAAAAALHRSRAGGAARGRDNSGTGARAQGERRRYLGVRGRAGGDAAYGYVQDL